MTITDLNYKYLKTFDQFFLCQQVRDKFSPGLKAFKFIYYNFMNLSKMISKRFWKYRFINYCLVWHKYSEVPIRNELIRKLVYEFVNCYSIPDTPVYTKLLSLIQGFMRERVPSEDKTHFSSNDIWDEFTLYFSKTFKIDTKL